MLEEEYERALSYRLPGSAVPGGGAWAGLQVALLHVGRLVQHIAVVVIEPLSAGSLADHQAGPPATAAGLRALRDEGRAAWLSTIFLVLTCFN